MSEYWKSTPKYWCKHCKTFVRDTKLEKTNHEATAKHQGNIKRFLRDLHRGHEREERSKDMAKNEVERLNGVISGTPSAAKGGPPGNRPTASSQGPGAREATPAERKAQLARLAEMGIAVPEDFRREMAMAGDWQTISQRPIQDRVKKEEGLDDFKDFKPDPTLNVGVRKRKFEGQEEEEDAGATVVRKGWGSTTRRYPGSDGGAQDDLDTLLSKSAGPSMQEMSRGDTAEPLLQPGAGTIPSQGGRSDRVPEPKPPNIKKEESDSVDMEAHQERRASLDIAVKAEDGTQAPAVMFKKRRSKASEKT
ncbi:MAG: hypothetical protein L6R36_008079 [Xanthoria steineri]|nr:MAG: hypothetical protein L6R36_008079 [Xanthoria steineri]